MRAFVTAWHSEAHDWRRSIATLPGNADWTRLEHSILTSMRTRGGIVPRSELEDIIRSKLTPMVASVECSQLVDLLLVKQVGAALRSLVLRDGRLHVDFDCSTVPGNLFWRKNAASDWERQCLLDRYGWFSDSASIRDLLSVLKEHGSAERFCRTMGFSRVPGKGDFGPMYFMFYTHAQLESLDVEFFRPTWTEVSSRLRALFDRRRAAGTLGDWLPKMWISDIDAWEAALAAFNEVVDAVAAAGDPARLRFLQFSLAACKPLWDLYEGKEELCDPRWHPVAAARHLLDAWFGANHLFMGDGFTWSETKERGHAEWLVSSFENYDVDRVSIFPPVTTTTTTAAASARR